VNETPYQLFGVKLLGVSSETLRKAILTLVFTLGIVVVRYVVEGFVRAATRKRPRERRSFWIRQTANLFTAALFLLALLSIWFDDPSRLATGVGLVSAGLAFALQKVVTSLAGYFVIIRSRVFTIGERITMGGVRGDVISLDFLKTTLMEMGDPAAEATTVWVRGRQYTGRIVTVTNDKIFEEPIFNSTRDFPFLWEEIQIPIPYAADRRRAETILLAAAQRATADIQIEAEPYRVTLTDQFHVDLESLAPRVYYRITDNWLELSLRFLSYDRFTRELKDRVTRDILQSFDEAGIIIASTTIDIIGFPPVRGTLRHAGVDGEKRPRESVPPVDAILKP
jgi:small-conductance mechanosensitive channel